MASLARTASRARLAARATTLRTGQGGAPRSLSALAAASPGGIDALVKAVVPLLPRFLTDHTLDLDHKFELRRLDGFHAVASTMDHKSARALVPAPYAVDVAGLVGAHRDGAGRLARAAFEAALDAVAAKAAEARGRAQQRLEVGTTRRLMLVNCEPTRTTPTHHYCRFLCALWQLHAWRLAGGDVGDLAEELTAEGGDVHGLAAAVLRLRLLENVAAGLKETFPEKGARTLAGVVFTLQKVLRSVGKRATLHVHGLRPAFQKHRARRRPPCSLTRIPWPLAGTPHRRPRCGAAGVVQRVGGSAQQARRPCERAGRRPPPRRPQALRGL